MAIWDYFFQNTKTAGRDIKQNTAIDQNLLGYSKKDTQISTQKQMTYTFSPSTQTTSSYAPVSTKSNVYTYAPSLVYGSPYATVDTNPRISTGGTISLPKITGTQTPSVDTSLGQTALQGITSPDFWQQVTPYLLIAGGGYLVYRFVIKKKK